MSRHHEVTNLVDNLYKIGRRFQNREKKPRYYGTNMLLYPNEAYTLKAIVESEGINQKDLSEQMYRTKGATSVVVQKLIQKGLAVSKNESSDQRIGSLYPTEAGMAVYKAHREYDKRYVDMMAKEINLSAEEFAKVNESIEKIMEVIDRRGKEHRNDFT